MGGTDLKWGQAPLAPPLATALLLIDLANSCHILYGFNAVLLCNGRFWDGFTSVTSASL